MFACLRDSQIETLTVVPVVRTFLSETWQKTAQTLFRRFFHSTNPLNLTLYQIFENIIAWCRDRVGWQEEGG